MKLSNVSGLRRCPVYKVSGLRFDCITRAEDSRVEQLPFKLAVKKIAKSKSSAPTRPFKALLSLSFKISKEFRILRRRGYLERSPISLKRLKTASLDYHSWISRKFYRQFIVKLE